MKKRKLFNVVVGTVLGCSMVCVAYHVYDSQGSRKLEDSLLLENVEALATDDESGEDAAMKARREECYQREEIGMKPLIVWTVALRLLNARWPVRFLLLAS